MTSLLFCAGDVSGDIHCAHLVREVLSRHPEWKIYALGGQHLREAGAKIVGDTTGFGVIGFASALSLIPRALRMRSRILQWLRQNPVDAVVLCDWGAFNVRLLRALKELAVPVLYYFPPRSWQKHGAGGLDIVPYVTQVATPFEWSAQRLRAAGCKAEWVGHPLLELVRAEQPKAQLRARYGVEQPDQKLIALLPGSRNMELKYIAPHLNATAQQLRRENANWKFVVAVPVGAKERAQKYFATDIEITEGRAAEILLACDAAVVKSGTATLEAAVADAPQLVVYNVPTLLRIQWLATGSNKKIPFVGMPNIILERKCAPEFLAHQCHARNLVPHLRRLLTEPMLCDTMRQGYTEVRRALGSELPVGATVRTATMIEEMLKSRD